MEKRSDVYIVCQESRHYLGMFDDAHHCPGDNFSRTERECTACVWAQNINFRIPIIITLSGIVAHFKA